MRYLQIIALCLMIATLVMTIAANRQARRLRAIAQRHHPVRYSIFHRPSGGCPPGTTEHPDMFTEGDGTHEAGCHDPTVPGIVIDVLKPGEGIALEFLLEVEPPSSETTGHT